MAGVVLILVLGTLCLSSSDGLLYPRESESREIKTLDSIWNFRADFSSSRTAGFTKLWFNQPLAAVTHSEHAALHANTDLIGHDTVRFMMQKRTTDESSSIRLCGVSSTWARQLALFHRSYRLRSL